MIFRVTFRCELDRPGKVGYILTEVTHIESMSWEAVPVVMSVRGVTDLLKIERVDV